MSVRAMIFAIAMGFASSALAAPALLTTASHGTVAYSFPEFSEFDVLEEGTPFTFASTASYDTRFIQHGQSTDDVDGAAAFTITAGGATVTVTSAPGDSASLSIIRLSNPGAPDGYDHSATYFTRIVTESFRIYDVYQTMYWKDDAYVLPDLLQDPGTLVLPAEHRFTTQINLWLGDDVPSSQLGLFVEDFSLNVSVVPEPHTAHMLLPGLALCYAARRRRQAR